MSASPGCSPTVRGRVSRVLFPAAWLVAALGGASCGARSGLDLAPGSAFDAPDADTADAPADVVAPPFDSPPPICVDGRITYIYVLTAQNRLWSYYPPTNSFARIGTLSCPTSAAPNSMAVDRGGTAYAVFTSGELFKVSTANAACAATSFVPGTHGFIRFGMGFASDTNDPGETLFVAESNFNGPSAGLGLIDTTTFSLSVIGAFSPPLYRTELTGTSDGRLFGFSIDNPGPGSHLSQIDKTTAKVLRSTPLAVGTNQDGFAYAFWGGSFYIFTSPGGPSTVTRYDPATKALSPINTHPDTIIGAGVSTCAPH